MLVTAVVQFNSGATIPCHSGCFPYTHAIHRYLKQEIVLLETTTLKDFVVDKNVASTRELGLVHTAKTAQLLSILNQRKLAVMPCNVFKGESLCCLFAGVRHININSKRIPLTG
jgi:hypothetical protein